MPNNRFIYFGVLIVAASALVWLGAWLTRRIEWFLPYSGVAGVVLIVIGVVMELPRKRMAQPNLASEEPSEEIPPQSS